MKRPDIRVIIPETPLYVEASAVTVNYVGLGQAQPNREHRVFILLENPVVPEGKAMIHVSIDDAAFLRDAIDTVLARHRQIADSTN